MQQGERVARDPNQLKTQPGLVQSRIAQATTLTSHSHSDFGGGRGGLAGSGSIALLMISATSRTSWEGRREKGSLTTP
jgi:hypothetical protein